MIVNLIRAQLECCCATARLQSRYRTVAPLLLSGGELIKGKEERTFLIAMLPFRHTFPIGASRHAIRVDDYYHCLDFAMPSDLEARSDLNLVGNLPQRATWLRTHAHAAIWRARPHKPD